MVAATSSMCPYSSAAMFAIGIGRRGQLGAPAVDAQDHVTSS